MMCRRDMMLRAARPMVPALHVGFCIIFLRTQAHSRESDCWNMEFIDSLAEAAPYKNIHTSFVHRRHT